jgi:pSer/pThr/pTyr-binding forkhead associated (FHA) protein
MDERHAGSFVWQRKLTGPPLPSMNEDTFFLKPLGDVGSVGVKLEPGRHTLGRDPTCDIVLTEVSISRRHAELRVDGRIVHIRDLNSRNGTFVNGQRIDEAETRIGDQISFASVAFFLVDGQEADLETDDPRLGSRTEPAGDGKLGEQATLAGRLSEAQHRVFERILKGLSEKEIAAELGVSRHTVHRHICRIYELAHVNSRSELLAMFVVRPDPPIWPK